MLATREHSDFHFYSEQQYNHLLNVANSVYKESCFNAGFMLDIPNISNSWDAPIREEIHMHVEDAYAHEVIVKQAEEGSLSCHFSQDEAKLALAEAEEYEWLYESVREFISYNGSFAYGISGLELDFLNDILYVFDSQRYFRMEIDEQPDVNARHNVDGLVFKAVNSPLQEVW